MMITDSNKNVCSEFQQIEDILSQVEEYGCFPCPGCGNPIEPDGECFCGAPNPLIEEGLI